MDLTDALFRWAAQNGCRRVIARVTRGNAGALALYREYGFEPAAETPIDSADDSIVLTRKVGPPGTP